MKVKLKQGDRLKLLPQKQLLELFEKRNFFSKDFRKEASEKLSEKEGTVNRIEDKYAFDYFNFLIDGEIITWSVPYQSVDFKEMSERTELKVSNDCCGVCGGKMVYIRGKYPKTPKRKICPTCTYERLEQINEISSEHYGKAYKATND